MDIDAIYGLPNCPGSQIIDTKDIVLSSNELSVLRTLFGKKPAYSLAILPTERWRETGIIQIL